MVPVKGARGPGFKKKIHRVVINRKSSRYIASELGRVPTAKAGLAAIRTGEDYPCVGLK